MLSDYLPLLVMLLAATAFAGGNLVLTSFLGPSRYSAVKGETYESGKPVVGDARARVSVKFYLIAVDFVIFDIEVAFLYPWAVVYKNMLTTGTFIFTAMMIFLGMLILGYAYLWQKGALEWE